ncbi:hypothetical protein HJC23_012077 [Cyclotella cryptica]|uniref:Site-specific DNA-methyltransferase (adenine-specific) n=1 Tax=Cyclotella cryptica TaxID=29204 RepID=A0ABD3PTI8_9STRA|eukprot:CCRYP_011671-RA/>CCRYP_011671-RA protein AED:0.40 eAED:0.40 QI:0/-1/0/1/-1/1/1/0/750
MDDEVKLLLTVSGGLEALAETQIQDQFNEVLLEHTWHKRTSGSQLYLNLRRVKHDDNDILNVIVSSMQQLDFVEYAFILVDSFDISNEYSEEIDDRRAARILGLIQEATSKIPKGSIDFCKRVCDLLDKQPLSHVDVGLGALPGVLLPTPDVPASESTDSISNACCQSFAVNTIYTQKGVSEVVVQTIIEFLHQYDQNYTNGEVLWVDAGSGDGSLLENLPKQRSIGVDTHPTSPVVHHMDFLELTRNWLVQRTPKFERLYVISNPPFSVSSRGDYSPIVRFINHSFDILRAEFVAVICPSKFARERIWESLGLTEQSHLWGRFLLPQNSFYDPSTGKAVHIHSICLIFGNHQMPSYNSETITSTAGAYISAKRDKGSFRSISTAQLTTAVVSGLAKTGMELVAERHARYMLNAKLLDSSFQLWWQVNYLRPCSSGNSNSAKIKNHSLGWISLSVKPAISLALSSLAIRQEIDNRKSHVVVNLMSGEGTIELESSRAVDYPFFMIAGDRRLDCVFQTSKRIASLKSSSNCSPLVDLVVWDAQNLPLRKGFADAVIGDLPIQGTSRKAHQQPTIGTTDGAPVGPSGALSYSLVLGETCRILRPKGRAALISVDYRSLGGACKKFNWSLLDHGTSINLGGLTGKMYVLERNEPCTKDLCLSVPLGSEDFSSWILSLSISAFENANDNNSDRKTNQPVAEVQLLNSFLPANNHFLRHCYRITFDDQIRNAGAKLLEKEIRRVVETNLMEGMSL